MLTAETKQRINTCRNILVGKVPDPKSQVLQITNALIYKFMDDQDRSAERLGGKSSFFINGLKPYAWHKLFDTKLTNQDRADKYVEGIAKLSTADHLPELFREIFKEAYVPFRAANVITLFISEINKFDYSHSEELGNAYEYLLSIMGSQGDAGQFRTPRHIIEFLVDVVDPQKGETIYDPAAGTAGFLIAAYKHIMEENKKLSVAEKRALAGNISGVDISPDMANMARVNLYLHNFTTPNINEGDTLTDEHLWGKKYDVILANPPFMSPKGGILPHDKFSIQAKRSEVLFVDYIAEHLKLKGRAGVIVPEGVIFQTGTAYKQLRKMLVDDGYLHSVISLPAGLFQPYSGVKTSMLILDRERAKETSEILFIKVEKDGYSLSTQRAQLCNENGDQPEWCPNHSDLPVALDVAKAWRNGEKHEAPIASWVSKLEIATNDEFNLSRERYQKRVSTQTAWPLVPLGEITERVSGGTPAKENKKFWQGSIPWISPKDMKVNVLYDTEDHISQEAIDASAAKLVSAGTLLCVVRSSILKHTLPLAVIARDMCFNQDIIALIPSDRRLDQRYLFSLLRARAKEILRDGIKPGVTVQSFYSGYFEGLEIPLPPLDVQKEILAEIEGYQKVIDGARQVVENYRPQIPIDPDWPMVLFDEVAFFQEGPGIRKWQFTSNGIKLLNVKNIVGDRVILDNSDKYVSVEEFNQKYRHFLVEDGDIILASSGATYGKNAYFVDPGYPVMVNTSNIRLQPKDTSRIVQGYIKIFLDSASFKSQIDRMVTGAAQPNFGPSHLKQVTIPLPPLDTQQQRVAEIEAEQALVAANRELTVRFEKKIQATLARVWGEDEPASAEA